MHPRKGCQGSREAGLQLLRTHLLPPACASVAEPHLLQSSSSSPSALMQKSRRSKQMQDSGQIKRSSVGQRRVKGRTAIQRSERRGGKKRGKREREREQA